MKKRPLITASRQERLVNELVIASRRVPSHGLSICVGDALKLFPKIGVRRVKNIGLLARSVSAGVLKTLKVVSSGDSVAARQLGVEHHTRVRAAFGNATRQLAILGSAIREDPRGVLPRIMVGALAAVTASGGPDGDGGIPDLDLKLGIDAHRSIVFHSVVAGTVVETLLFGLARLVGTVYPYLPARHDALWDAIARHKDDFLQCAAQGASAGLAYHLVVDGTVQAAPYHGLPFSMPMEAHQALLVANAAAEGADISKKDQSYQSAPVSVHDFNRSPIKEIIGDDKAKIFAWGAEPYLKEALLLDANVTISMRTTKLSRTLRKRGGSAEISFRVTSGNSEPHVTKYGCANVGTPIREFLRGLNNEVITLAVKAM
jgi:hypothetical protein